MSRTLLNKGQLQIGESMMVIMIVLFVGVIGLVFVFNNAKEEIKIQLTESEGLSAIETAQLVTNMYELRCAKTGLRTTCIDLHKALAVELSQSDEEIYLYYNTLLKDAKIVVKEVYPNTQEIVIYEVNASATEQESTLITIPVSLYDATTDTVSFGVLEIYRYFLPVVI